MSFSSEPTDFKAIMEVTSPPTVSCDSTPAKGKPTPALLPVQTSSVEVQRCLEKTRPQVGKSLRVDYSATERCHRGFFLGKRSSGVNHLLTRTAQGFKIDVSYSLTIYAGKFSEQAIWNRLRTITPCIKNIYARAGIELNLTLMDNGLFNGNMFRADHGQFVYGAYERATAGSWAIFEMGGLEVTEEMACAIVAHEIGHKLGLPDRYEDEECPARNTKFPTNTLMKNPYHPEATLAEEDIKILLAPLCRGAPLQPDEVN